MKKWDNGVVSLKITSCMSYPEKKQIMTKRKVSGQWVTALRGVFCKRTGMAVRLMGIAESCPLPEYDVPKPDTEEDLFSLVKSGTEPEGYDKC